MKTLFLASLALSFSLNAFGAEPKCSIFTKSNGEVLLNAGNQRFLEIEIARTQEHYRLMAQICSEVRAAISCRGYELPRDEYLVDHYDGSAHTPPINMGRNRAMLTIGILPSWIMQFAKENYRKDQSGVYYSVEACESNRSRIAIEVATRSHDVIQDQERQEKARRHQELIDEYNRSNLGPKY
jgi:hypothetical protein